MTYYIHYVALLSVLVLLESCASEKKHNAVIFPNTNYSKVIAYDYAPSQGESIYNFRTNQLYHTIKKEQALTEEQVNNLLAVLNDKNSYGGDVSRCFTPRLGVVFYDAAGQAKAEISICLECNQHQSNPRILAQEQAKTASTISLHGYSNEGRQKLVAFCKSLNFTNCGVLDEVDDEDTEEL